MYQFGVQLRLKSPISVCLTDKCTLGAAGTAIRANYVRSWIKSISCCNDIVRESLFFPANSWHAAHVDPFWSKIFAVMQPLSNKQIILYSHTVIHCVEIKNSLLKTQMTRNKNATLDIIFSHCQALYAALGKNLF